MTVMTRLSGRDYPLKITANEFLALADAGLFAQFGRTELIEGEVWTMNAVHQWHARTQGQFIIAIHEALRLAGSDLIVYGAGSVMLGDSSMPEPDIAVVSPRVGGAGFLPSSALRIAVELSDTTSTVDLGRKAALYARFSIPEYWVADRDTQTVIRHAGPSDQGYADVLKLRFGAAIVSATLEGVSVDTACLIG